MATTFIATRAINTQTVSYGPGAVVDLARFSTSERDDLVRTGGIVSSAFVRALASQPEFTDGFDAAGTAAAAVAAQAVVDSGTYGRTLARVTYNPGSITTYTTSSTSYVDLDATNLQISFTVPASGQVVLKLIGYAEVNAANEYVGWGVRSSGALVTGSDALVMRGNATNDGGRQVHECIITGLTPGAVVTWTWAHKSQAGGAVRTVTGGVYGQSLITVKEVVTPLA